MIIQIILLVLIGALNFISSFLPTVTTLPLGIDDAMVTLFGWLRSFIENVWPVQIIFDVIIFYLGFKLLLLMLKFFLGTRNPTSN